MTERKKHLYYMNELSNYKFSKGYPDVRGWTVKDIDNRVIGKVDNLLVNIELERVVYLDVEVDQSIIDARHDPYGRPGHVDVKEFINKDGENHIIIPIGLVELNTDSDYVYTDVIDHRTFAETKRYRKGGTVDRAYEVQVMDSYRRKVHPDEMAARTTDNVASEARIREIVREEIREYHNVTDSTNGRETRSARDPEDTAVLTKKDPEVESSRYERNYEDDRYYERSEFDDRKFRKNRNPIS